MGDLWMVFETSSNIRAKAVTGMGYKKRLECAFGGAPVYHKKAHLFCEREVCFFLLCVHPHAITCIEIENDIVTLAKWQMNARADGSIFVEHVVGL